MRPTSEPPTMQISTGLISRTTLLRWTSHISPGTTSQTTLPWNLSDRLHFNFGMRSITMGKRTMLGPFNHPHSRSWCELEFKGSFQGHGMRKILMYCSSYFVMVIEMSLTSSYGSELLSNLHLLLDLNFWRVYSCLLSVIVKGRVDICLGSFQFLVSVYNSRPSMTNKIPNKTQGRETNESTSCFLKCD